MAQKIMSIKAAICYVGCLFTFHAQGENVDNLRHQIFVHMDNAKKMIMAEQCMKAAQALTAAADSSLKLAQALAAQHEEARDYHKAAWMHAQLGDYQKAAQVHERASRLANDRGNHQEAKKHIIIAVNYREALERSEASQDASGSWNERDYEVVRP